MGGTQEKECDTMPITMIGSPLRIRARPGWGNFGLGLGEAPPLLVLVPLGLRRPSFVGLDTLWRGYGRCLGSAFRLGLRRRVGRVRNQAALLVSQLLSQAGEVLDRFLLDQPYHSDLFLVVLRKEVKSGVSSRVS